MKLNPYESPVEPPTLWEVLQVARDSGLVGEADTVLTLVLTMLSGGLVIMTGPARAGKDECVDAAEEVYDSADTVYRWPSDDSATAAYYKRHEINQYPVHRFPDLARLEPHHEKILKAFGEGRDAHRDKTDITGDEGEEVKDQVLECPNTIIAFIASDNEQINLDDYPELRNRALTLSVDASEQQTRRVNRRKAMEHAGVVDKNVEPVRKMQIQEYHASVPVGEWIERRDRKIVNPMAINIHDQEPIPELYPEARQDFDRLLEFMKTVTLYHYSQRVVHDSVMVVSPVDVWIAMTIIGNKMVMSALNLTRQDRAILTLLDENTSVMTKAEIQQSLRAQGFNITDRDVQRSVDTMRGKGYVRVHQGNPNEYSFNEFGSVMHHDAGIDYSEAVEAAAGRIYDVVPGEVADTYVDRFCGGTGLITTHPFTGEAVDITEVNELEEMIDDGVEQVESVFDEEEAGPEQGTLT